MSTFNEIYFSVIIVFQILAIITLSILLYEIIGRTIKHIRMSNKRMLASGRYVILSSNI